MTAETLITKRNKIFKIWYFPWSLIMSLVNSNQFCESFSQWKRLLRANLKKGFSEKKKKGSKAWLCCKKKKKRNKLQKCVFCVQDKSKKGYQRSVGSHKLQQETFWHCEHCSGRSAAAGPLH